MAVIIHCGMWMSEIICTALRNQWSGMLGTCGEEYRNLCNGMWEPVEWKIKAWEQVERNIGTSGMEYGNQWSGILYRDLWNGMWEPVYGE
jgi:hypothetical protein